MGKGRMHSAKWILKNSKSVLWQVLLLSALGILISYISVRFALASRDLLDCATGSFEGSFKSCIITIVCLLVADISVQSVYNILSVRLGAIYKNSMQRKLFKDVMATDFASLSEYHSGELINRLTKDVSSVSANIIDFVPTVIILLSGIIMSFWALFTIDSSLALICIALGPVVLVSSLFYGKKVKKLHKDCLRSDGKILSFMQESIQNLLVIKAFRKENKFDFTQGKLQGENYKLNMKVGYVSLLVNVLYFLALTAAYYFAVAWCAYKIHIGLMTVGAFAAVIQLVGSVQAPFKEVSGMFSKFFATLASAERIMEVEELKKDNPGIVNITDFKGIEINDVSFSYGDEPVLSKVGASVKRGDIVAVTGDSGSGKSTLIKLLLGIYPPADGEMYIYNKKEKLSAGSETRTAFSYVPQGNMIISGSIADNISFFDDNPDIKKIENAAKTACIYDYIQTLPEGMNTLVGENGMGLSEGQIQRLAIARAIYEDAPVILLDEATASLDEKTEAGILANIKSMGDKTCIIITHRPKALEIATTRLHIENREATIV